MIAIGYFADGPWSHLALEKLVADESISIKFICARYDTIDPILRMHSESLGIDFLFHSDINSINFCNRLKLYQCDLFVSMSFNQIFKKSIIDMPPLGVINCHAGKLPYYRGRNILNWALINDEKEFGITVHYVDEGVDTGDIISQISLSITDEDNYETLLNRAYIGCSEILYETIKDIQSGTANRIRQETINPIGLYCITRLPGDENLNWNQTSRDAFNFIRALCRPGPMATTLYGKKEIKINCANLVPDAPIYKGIPGSVLARSRNGYFVKTNDSFIEITEWSGIDHFPVGTRLK